jgi:leucyl-tRNA synthetase
LGPWTQGSDWDASGIDGVDRFLKKVWTIGTSEEADGPRDRKIDRALHRTIQKVTEDLEAYHFNTAIAAMMELVNELQRARGPSRAEATRALVLLLAPFAPYITEELWERAGGIGSVHQQTWPAYDAALAAADQVTLVVQVDGKVRDRVGAPAGLSEAAARELALGSSRATAALDGREIARVVVVPDRLVNIVTRRRP